MIEIITDYVIPTGGIYAFGLFSIHISDSVRFIATRLGILNSSQGPVNEEEADAQSPESEQASIETIEGGFAEKAANQLLNINQILEDMTGRHEKTDIRMLNLHKHNQSMFSRLSRRLETNERLFDEIIGPLEEIIQGIHDKSSTSSQVDEIDPGRPVYDNDPVDTEMEVIQYD